MFAPNIQAAPPEVLLATQVWGQSGPVVLDPGRGEESPHVLHFCFSEDASGVDPTQILPLFSGQDPFERLEVHLFGPEKIGPRAVVIEVESEILIHLATFIPIPTSSPAALSGDA